MARVLAQVTAARGPVRRILGVATKEEPRCNDGENDDCMRLCAAPVSRLVRFPLVLAAGEQQEMERRMPESEVCRKLKFLNHRCVENFSF